MVRVPPMVTLWIPRRTPGIEGAISAVSAGLGGFLANKLCWRAALARFPGNCSADGDAMAVGWQ